MGKKRIDLTGQRFGRLVVTSLNEEVSKQKKGSYWNCICDCGNNCTINGTRLKSGKTKSCGCLMREKSSENAKKLWANEDFREKHSEKQSRLAKKQWEDEEFRKMQCDRTREQMKQQWDNEEFRQAQSDRMKKQMKEKWQDEEYRQIKSDKMREMWQDEEYRQAMSEKTKKQWEDEEFRKLKIEQGKKQYHPKGELHPNYNHDMTDEERREGRLQEGYDAWTKQVKANADYTCECCGKRGGKLHSHHKDGYKWCKERRIDISNGACLCEKCHREFHSRYGTKNNTEQQYIEFKEEKTKKCE